MSAVGSFRREKQDMKDGSCALCGERMSGLELREGTRNDAASLSKKEPPMWGSRTAQTISQLRISWTSSNAIPGEKGTRWIVGGRWSKSLVLRARAAASDLGVTLDDSYMRDCMGVLMQPFHGDCDPAPSWLSG